MNWGDVNEKEKAIIKHGGKKQISCMLELVQSTVFNSQVVQFSKPKEGVQVLVLLGSSAADGQDSLHAFLESILLASVINTSLSIIYA